MGQALICYQILLTNSCWKCMEISLESLYLYTGEFRENVRAFFPQVQSKLSVKINDVSLLIGFDCNLIMTAQK